MINEKEIAARVKYWDIAIDAVDFALAETDEEITQKSILRDMLRNQAKRWINERRKVIKNKSERESYKY